MSNVTTINGKSFDANDLARKKIYAGIPDEDVALALSICNKYGLDPLLKHVVMIAGNSKDERGNYIKKYTVYITRDGLLHVAHSSGQLDGMRTTIGQDELGIWAECSVYRKDMSHEFTYKVYMDEYKSTTQVWTKYAKSMLIKVAEVFTLRRAFDVALTPIEEMGFENTGYVVDQDGQADIETDPGSYRVSFKSFSGKISEMTDRQLTWLANEYDGKDKKAQQCARDYLLTKLPKHPAAEQVILNDDEILSAGLDESIRRKSDEDSGK